MFGSIVVGTDGSDTAKTAVRYAIDLARELGSRLQIVSAYQPVSDPLMAIQGHPYYACDVVIRRFPI